MAKLYEMKFELLPHSPYSPDSVPRDFLLFQNMKKRLARKRFGSNEDAITETEAYFEELLKSHFLDGLKQLENRWAMFIELQGDYVRKKM